MSSGRKRRRAPDLDFSRPDDGGGAEGRKRELAVIPRGDRLLHPRDAIGVESREENRRLDLRARDGKLVLDAAEFSAARDGHREIASTGLDRGSHPAERNDDAVERTPGKTLVSYQPAFERLSGKNARGHAGGRA